MAMPGIENALMWIIDYPRTYGQVGYVAVGVGAAAAYYTFGSPIEAVQNSDWMTLGQGYLVGAAASSGVIYANDRTQCAQYVPNPQ